MRTVVTASMVQVVDTSTNYPGGCDDAFRVVESLLFDGTHITTSGGHMFEVGRGPALVKFNGRGGNPDKVLVDKSIYFLLVWSPPGVESVAGKTLMDDLRIHLVMRGVDNV